MRTPDRRTLLALPGLAAVAAVTDLDLGYERDNVARFRANVDGMAATWNTVGASENLAGAYALENHLAIVAPPRGQLAEWAELTTASLVMLAQIQADKGLDLLAARTAQRAQHAALKAGGAGAALGADALVVEAELWNAVASTGDAPIDMLARAREAGGRSHVSVRAAVSEATARAGRGEAAETVVGILLDAEQMQRRLPPSAGHPPWTLAHFHAFGGVAAVRCGALAMASEWLALAAVECVEADMPGLGTAVTLYQAQGYAAGSQWDAALATASDAVASAAERGAPPVWLTGGVGRVIREAAGRGGDWSALAAYAA